MTSEFHMTNRNDGYWLNVGEDDSDADESGYVYIPSERELSRDDDPSE